MLLTNSCWLRFRDILFSGDSFSGDLDSRDEYFFERLTSRFFSARAGSKLRIGVLLVVPRVRAESIPLCFINLCYTGTPR